MRTISIDAQRAGSAVCVAAVDRAGPATVETVFWHDDGGGACDLSSFAPGCRAVRLDRAGAVALMRLFGASDDPDYPASSGRGCIPAALRPAADTDPGFDGSAPRVLFWRGAAAPGEGPLSELARLVDAVAGERGPAARADLARATEVPEGGRPSARSRAIEAAWRRTGRFLDLSGAAGSKRRPLSECAATAGLDFCPERPFAKSATSAAACALMRARAVSGLSAHPALAAPLATRERVIEDHPSCRRAADGGPRRDRACASDSPRRVAELVLAPDAPIADLPAPSAAYPSPAVAAARGQAPADLMADNYSWLISRVGLEAARKALGGAVALFSRALEGSGEGPGFAEAPLLGPDGEPCGCYVAFSLGGAHGGAFDADAPVTDARRPYSCRQAPFAGRVLHLDFDSYYPNILANLCPAGAGSARLVAEVGSLLERKGDLGAAAADPFADPGDRADAARARAAVKLVLNSASGALAWEGESNLRAPNLALSMRLVGQAVIWRLAQELAFAGWLPVSINTDGVHVVCGGDQQAALDAALAVASRYALPLSAGPCDLACAGANDRVEFDVFGGEAVSAAGQTMTGWAGADPSRAPAPPVVARAIVRRLRDAVDGRSSFEEADADDMLPYVAAELEGLGAEEALPLLSVVTRPPAPGAVMAVEPVSGGEASPVGAGSHRCVLVRRDCPAAVRVLACSWEEVGEAEERRREAADEPADQSDPRALSVLAAAGSERPGEGFEARARVPEGMPAGAAAVVCGRSDEALGEAARRLTAAAADLGSYADLAACAWNRRWRSKARRSEQNKA